MICLRLNPFLIDSEMRESPILKLSFPSLIDQHPPLSAASGSNLKSEILVLNGCSCGYRYLILHLKRFKLTENLVMVKLEDPIILCREMTVTAHQGDQLYSLISVISHVGSSVRKGHYVSNGLHPDHTLEDGEDRWLHFNDIYVLETSGAMVSEWSTEDSYVLIYQRRAWPALV
ncbi:hypothetical protein ATANTOWER_029051 [Ataeniobius toweri]|uniref:USP domain-containing protein n=1 Tax=Ataeniobius toweri TaxID=208326 RepID=A0ABU7B017_9TELE|nr:hypothetical protein [Ataeniobius toweri]